MLRSLVGSEMCIRDRLSADASLAKEEPTEGYAQAITFFHAKLHFIHPFRNGNSRTNLALTQGFAYHELAKRKVPEVSLEKLEQLDKYRLSRATAQLTGNINQLAKSLLGIKVPEQSPAPMELRLHVEHKQLSNGLFVAVACNQAKEVHNWHELRDTPRFENEIADLSAGEMDFVEGILLYVGNTPEEARSLAVGTQPQERLTGLEQSPSTTRGKHLELDTQDKMSRDLF